MTSVNVFLEKIRKEMPDLISTSEMVQLGIYKTQQAAYMARKKHTCPLYIKIPQRGIVYPKQGVIEYLEKQIKKTEKLVC